MRTVSIRLESVDLGRLRWAISPLWEAVASIRALADPARSAVHVRWLARHRDDPVLRDPLVNALVVQPRTSFAGFLAPTPTSPTARFADEILAVRATESDVVRREIEAGTARQASDALRAMLDDPAAGLTRLTARLEEYWERTLAPVWPRMLVLLQRDITHRAAALTRDGPESVLPALHPNVDWRKGTLAVRFDRLEPSQDLRHLDGRGLVLVPTVFGWPHVFVKTDTPWSPVLRYPARGSGTLWEDTRSEQSSGLAAVLGNGRARILHALATPSTTTQLSTMLGCAAGGVSAHLKRLTTAGLVTPQRVGREVVYARTARGDALFEADG